MSANRQEQPQDYRSSTATTTATVPTPGHQRMVLVVVLLGVMVAAVDTTIVILGLPVMMVDLHSDIVSMVWVIMAYLLTLIVLGTQVGRLGDMYDRMRMYNLGFLVFTVGSVLCGLSQTAPQLIALRVLQAIGGALISANSGAIIADNVPPTERGHAYGLTSIGWNVGAILGILLGGVAIHLLHQPADRPDRPGSIVCGLAGALATSRRAA